MDMTETEKIAQAKAKLDKIKSDLKTNTDNKVSKTDMEKHVSELENILSDK